MHFEIDNSVMWKPELHDLIIYKIIQLTLSNSNSKGDNILFELQRDSISRNIIIRVSYVFKIDGDFQFIRIIERFE